MTVLRGVNWPGLEYRSNHGMTLDQLKYIITNTAYPWNIKIIRRLFNKWDYLQDKTGCIYDCKNADCVNDCCSNNSYRQILRNFVNWCSSLKITVILSLVWETPQIGGYCPSNCPCPNTQSLVPGLPDHDTSVAMWTTMAQDVVFKNNPYVWFDIFGEPHNVTFSSLYTFMNDCVTVIRNAGANNVCLVGGLAWATDISVWSPSKGGTYLPTNLEPVMYDSHPYGPSLKGSMTCSLDNVIGPASLLFRNRM